MFYFEQQSLTQDGDLGDLGDLGKPLTVYSAKSIARKG